MQIETSHTMSPVWSYMKSKGLFAGVSLEGTVLIERNDENAFVLFCPLLCLFSSTNPLYAHRRSYGRKIKAADILNGDTFVPHWVEGLHETIHGAEGALSPVFPFFRRQVLTMNV